MKKWKFILLSFLICFFIFPITVRADMGPKDLLTVYVKNPPAEEYYLDLLTNEITTRYEPNYITDPQIITLLYHYESKGWLPALTNGGTGGPMHGSLTGKPGKNRMIHKFSYVGVPQTYRIIIVTKSGKIHVTDAYTRKALQSSVTYDYATGKTTPAPLVSAYLAQFSLTFILTLLIEGVILLKFNINFKKNWKTFLSVNFITQLLLTLTVGLTLVKAGPLGAFFMQILMEFMILALEILAYRFTLIGVSNACKIKYAVAANLASWFAGFFLLQLCFELTAKILG